MDRRRTARLAADFFAHGSNAILVVAIAVLLGWLRQGAWVGALLGLAMFPLLEYGLHRFVLHARPARWGWLYRLQCVIHYDHHQQTERLDRLFVPPYLLVPMALGLFGLYAGLARSMPSGASVLVGNLIGLLYYEWTHYRAHTPGAPWTPWGRHMKRYHLWHHFKNEHYWFGVTTPWVDRLAGTEAAIDQVEPSLTARVLFPGRPASS